MTRLSRRQALLGGLTLAAAASQNLRPLIGELTTLLLPELRA